MYWVGYQCMKYSRQQTVACQHIFKAIEDVIDTNSFPDKISKQAMLERVKVLTVGKWDDDQIIRCIEMITL
jgi:hypothetical protein